MTVPLDIPVVSLSAIWFNSVKSAFLFVTVVVESSIAVFLFWIVYYTIVDPLLNPTILSLPVSIPKNATILVINVVKPLFE